MLVGVAVLELQIPGVRNLKEKRRVVQALVERLHARLRVSVAETEIHDFPQRAEIGVAIVHSSEKEIERLLELVRALVENHDDVILVSWEPEILEVGA